MRRHQILIAITVLAAILRLAYLGVVPGGFTPDEADQGYAAYSLLKTGRDEWGISWPITSFRAFADYRAPLQTYLMMPSIAIFGLNEFAVRLPSALFGILSVVAVYLLANELFAKYRPRIGQIAAFFLAISPWSIQFSRTALEANFASFLFPMGLYLFLRGMKGNSRLLILSAIVLGVDLYSYLAAKLFVPLFLFGYLVINRRQVIKDGFRRLIPFLLIFSLFATPLYIDAIFGPGNVRGKDLAITNFSSGNLATISNEQYFSPLNVISPQLSRIFSNKIVFTAKQFVGNYISYLSPTFWFTEGGREITYSVFPGEGLLPFWLFLLVACGVYCLITNKEKKGVILLAWLLLAIIPAAITKEGYRPNRVGSLLTFWEIIAAYGTVEFFTRYQISKPKFMVMISTIFVMIFSYVNFYAFVAPFKYPTSLVYGYRDLIKKVNQYSDNYQTIIFDRGSQSQIFVAFYNQMDPKVFQQYSSTWWPEIEKKKLLFLDMLDPYYLGKNTFKSFNSDLDLKSGNLIVIRSEKMNPSLEQYVLDKVDYPNRTPAFYLLTYDQKQK